MQAADLLHEYEARIAMLERLVGRQALEIEFLKGGLSARTSAEKRDYVRRCRPTGLSVSRGCTLMGLPRSTFYDQPAISADATELLARLTDLCDAFEGYGYRRVGAALRQQGIIVNGKKLRRLMREHGLQPRLRRRFKATTDSDHDLPVFPNVAAELVPDGPNQLWIADLTYIAVPNGFVYLAVILDAWSRKAVGYAVSRSLEARTAVAALEAALAARSPPKGCVHPFRPRIAVCLRRLPEGARRAWTGRLDGTPRQSLR